jgi:hypothetical protein
MSSALIRIAIHNDLDGLLDLYGFLIRKTLFRTE